MPELQRGTVQVVAYDTRWPLSFERERSSLQEILGSLAVDIQHVGSTAVPGLAAKPIVDIALALANWDEISEVSKHLAETEWIERGWTIELTDDQSDGDYLFVKECEPECRSHHLHVVQINTLQWSNYIRFRDALIENSGIRTHYARLKNELAFQFATDRKSYTAAKDEFIRSILKS